MRQTKKEGQRRFGMKCHIGADAGSGPAHTIEVAAARAGIKLGAGKQSVKSVFVLCQSLIWNLPEAKLPHKDAERRLRLPAHKGLLALDNTGF